ncbi:MAG: hypothetical protein SV775_12170, partial [Thermodesulfobacteriota bacterium]|nr:hypothetical protein [Thermodesulfobacteriota bacterium]
LKAGYDGTFLPAALEKKYKNAVRELVWQWFFPAKTLTLVPESRELRIDLISFGLGKHGL